MSIKLNNSRGDSKKELETDCSSIKTNSSLNVQNLYKILINKPNLVNLLDDKNESILSYSIKNHNIPNSNLILTSPVLDLGYQDKDGNSYLHLAILYKEVEIVKALIKKGIFLNKKNKEGNTALHLAYMKYDKEIINILEENGIDTNIVNNENKLAEEMNPNLRPNICKCCNNINLCCKEINKRKNPDKNIIIINNNLNLKNINNPNNKIPNNYQTKMKQNNIHKQNNNNNIKTNHHTINIINSITTIPNNYSKNIIKPSKPLTNNEKKDTNEEILSIEDYKTRFQNYNKKYPECQKTIKMDCELIKDKYYDIIDKKEDSSEHGQNIDNLEEKCNNNSLSIEDKNNKIKTNKKSNSLINTNKTSPTLQLKNKMKKLIKGRNKNNKQNTCFGNLVGFKNLKILNNNNSIKSDKIFNTKHASGKMIDKKIDNSSSTKNIHNADKSKTNALIKNNEKLNEFNEENNFNNNNNDRIINTNTQNKNQSKNLINSKNNIKKNNIINNNKSKEINKSLNIISQNVGSSPLTQNNNKINSEKKNIPLKEFLSQINLLKYYNNMDSNGFDDINILIEEAKKGSLIKDEELKEVGIEIPGDRAKILIRIKEKANIFGFSLPKGVYHICKNLEYINDDNYISELKNWLQKLKVEAYLMNFIKGGYHSLELLLIQMATESPLTQEILKNEIGIDIVGYRSRILNKLKEDGKNMNNKLKTTTLIVNNIDKNKNCECVIF